MPLSPTEAGFATAFSRFSCFGAVRLRRLYKRFESFEAAWRATREDLLAAGFSETEAAGFLGRQESVSPEKEAAFLQGEGIRTLTPEDAEFPKLLREISDAPAFLHVRGELFADGATVACVGTRNASIYGLEMARKFGRELSEAGVIVISGLAIGIDAAVHRGAIDGGGPTWAFLPSGLNAKSIYPPSNRGLAEEIIKKGGALLSEFPPGAAGHKHVFPIRNRLIAGASLGTVVVEAAERSGSLLTARAALGYNREVFAVPGDPRRDGSAGPHLLIREGAELIRNTGDILSTLRLRNVAEEKPFPETISPLERRILTKLARENTPIDDLAREVKLSVAEAGEILSRLEILGHVRASGGMWAKA